jgi:antitoxin HigA-1
MVLGAPLIDVERDLTGLRLVLERLGVVSRIAVHAVFLTVQQLAQHIDVGNVRRRRAQPIEARMIRNRMRPIHPGEILREEFLLPLQMSAHALSQAIRVPATRVNDIVNGKRGITADTALRLARYFGNSPDFWMNLQAAYDLRAAEREASVRIEREVSPREAA